LIDGLSSFDCYKGQCSHIEPFVGEEDRDLSYHLPWGQLGVNFWRGGTRSRGPRHFLIKDCFLVDNNSENNLQTPRVASRCQPCKKNKYK
jgi:hypothetical protein